MATEPVSCSASGACRPEASSVALVGVKLLVVSDDQRVAVPGLFLKVNRPILAGLLAAADVEAR